MKMRFPICIQLIALAAVLSCANTAVAAANAKKATQAPKTTTTKKVATAPKAPTAPALPSAADIMKKVREKEATLKSYSFNIHRLDLADQYVLHRNDEGLKSYKAILDKLSFLTRQDAGVSKGEKGYKEAISTVQFIKPYLIQYYMAKSDFVPSFLQRAKVIYRPDINDEEIFLKEPYFGMKFGKEASSESASVMIQNWTYELMEIDCVIANGGEMKVAGKDTYDGRSAYMLDVSLKKGKIPWAVGCGSKSKDIPKNAYAQVSREMQMMADRIDSFNKEHGFTRYWIDANSWLILKKETMFGKTAAIKYEITNVKLNSVKPDDIEPVKKK